MLDDLSFDFCAYQLDLYDELTEEDCDDYLDDVSGEFDWGAYHRGYNEFLTMADISAYMDDESGEFDWDTYESDQLGLMTPETINEDMTVRIDWGYPAYLDIEAYRVEILGADGEWYDDESCDGSTVDVVDNLSCTIDQESLKAFPFELTQDDVVVARVTAYDGDGEDIG